MSREDWVWMVIAAAVGVVLALTLSIVVAATWTPWS